MKLKYIRVLLVIIIIVLGGCNRKSNDEGTVEAPKIVSSVHDEIKMDIQKLTIGDNYNADFDFFDCEQLESPFGILCRDEDILVTDRTLNKVVVFDYQGKVVKEIGKTGNGNLEFLNPTGITSYESKIYIIDALNDRIQILDEGLNYVDEIPLEPLSPDPNKEYYWYQDIIIRNENEIYLTTSYVVKEYANIYLIKDQKDQSIWKEEFNGFGTIHDERVYFNAFYELRDDGGVIGQSYFLYSNHADEMTQIDVPYRFSPRDLIVTDENIYVINGMFMCLDAYTKEGEYIETLYKFSNTLEDISYIPDHMDMDENNCFYLTDEKNKTLIKVSKKN